MEDKSISEEEIKEYERKMTKFYEDRLPFIRLQQEYETKKADVMESRVRMIRANDFMLQYEMRQKEQEELLKKDLADDSNKS